MMSRKLAVARHSRFLSKLIVGVAVLIGLTPVVIKVNNGSLAQAETPGTTCVAISQASKDHLLTTYPGIYSSEPDPTKTMVEILDPSLVVGTTEHDDKIVCVPSFRLRRLLGMLYADATIGGLKGKNTVYGDETCFDGDRDKRYNDLTGISYATNLRIFGGWCGMVSDLTPLSNLTSLEIINLRRHAIRDLTPLASLINLRSLSLNDNQIKDFSPLVNLPNLDLNYIQNFGSDGQVSVIEMAGRNSYVSELRDLTGNHPVIDSASLTNVTFDPATNIFTMIDPGAIAVVAYDYGDNKQPSVLYLLPNGLRGKTTEIEVAGGGQTVYQSDAYVINSLALNQLYPRTENQYGAYFNQIIYGDESSVLRLEERLDDGVVPTVSEVLLDGVPFNDTKYSKLYRAKTVIDDQRVIAVIVPRDLLPDGDPDKPTPEEWNAIWHELSLMPYEERNDLIAPFGIEVRDLLNGPYHRSHRVVSLRTRVRAGEDEASSDASLSNNLSLAFLQPVASDGVTMLTFEQLLNLSDYQIAQGRTVNIRIRQGGTSAPQVPKTGLGRTSVFWGVIGAGLAGLGGAFYWRSKLPRRHYRS